jgi:DNA mismatch repair protein MSH5
MNADANTKIDFSGSAEAQRTVVKSGVNPQLDEMKHQYDGMDSLLSAVSKEMLAHLPKDAQFDNVIYFPQIGYLIVVSLDPDTGRPLYQGERDTCNPWEQIFSTESKAYYKSNEMREMDGHFGDLHGMISGKIGHDIQCDIC